MKVNFYSDLLKLDMSEKMNDNSVKKKNFWYIYQLFLQFYKVFSHLLLKNVCLS